MLFTFLFIEFRKSLFIMKDTQNVNKRKGVVFYEQSGNHQTQFYP